MTTPGPNWLSPPRVVEELAIETSAPAVWRFLSYPDGTTPPARSADRIAQEIPAAQSWIQARGVYRIDPPEAAAALRLPLPPHQVERAIPVAPVAFVLGVVTAGPRLEEQIRHRLAAGDSVGALILDAIGSAAAEEAADRLTIEILDRLAGRASAPPPNGHPGCRVSPGYGAWPLESQRELFARLPHDEIGVSLLPSFLMVPRKSISFALWLDAAGHPVRDQGGCACCPQLDCPQRR